MTAGTTDRFASLDGLRGISALIVVLFHLEILALVDAGVLHGLRFFERTFYFVDFFFVLSGFVISYNYLGRLRDADTLGDFIVRRVARIYPLHLFVLVGFIALEFVKLHLARGGVPVENAPFTGANSVFSIFTHLLLIQSTGINPDPTWNGPSWSIGAEFLVYFFFALWAVVLWRTGASIRRAVTIGSALVFVVVSAVVVGLWSPEYIATMNGYAIPRCVYGFFCGVLLQDLNRRMAGSLRLSHGFATVLEVATLVGVVWFVSEVGVGPLSMVAPLLFVPVVLLFAQERGAVSSLLKSGPFAYIGHVSYTIYICHALVFAFATKAIRYLAAKDVIDVGFVDYVSVDGNRQALIKLASPLEQNLLVVALVVLVLVVSHVLNRTIEDPVRFWVNRLVARRREQVAAPAPMAADAAVS